MPKRRNGKGDSEELLKKKKLPIPLISFERKKFGGIRMLMLEMFEDKGKFRVNNIIYSLTDVIIALNATNVS